MAVPTRFPSGVTNRRKSDPLGDFLVPDPTTMAVFFDDFFRWDAGDWTVTTTEVGAGSATEVIADEDGGVLLITNAAGAADAVFAQTTGEVFTFESGKRLYFKARFKTSDATQSNIVFGLQVTDTTPLAVVDGVFFRKDDGDANLDVVMISSGASNTTDLAVATIANDAFVEVAFAYNGVDEVVFYVDGAVVANLATANLPSTELTVSFGLQNGEAAAKTLSVDYLLAAKER